MSEVNIREYLGWGDRPVQVDATAGIIRGVKVLGLQSRNGRRYLEDALRSAVPLYEGAKVNVNHPHPEVSAPRDYRDRLGLLRQVQYRDGEGLFADLYFNPKHDVAERLIWDAQHAPQNVGLSHNVLARIRQEDDTAVVYEIVRVLSVDLVADPATTEGLFEAVPLPHAEPMSQSPAANGTSPHDLLREEVQRLRRELALRRQLQSSQFAPPGENAPGQLALGNALWEVLLREADNQRRGRLLAELAEMIRSLRRHEENLTARPVARDALSGRTPTTAAEFAQAITRQDVG